MWSKWKAFTASLAFDPYLNCLEPHLHVSVLQVFAHKVRHRRTHTGGEPVTSKRVQDYLRTVAEEIVLGSKWRTDPRYGTQFQQHLALRQQRRAYSKADPPPNKVKPIPLQLVRHACSQQPPTCRGRALASALINGFFCTLRPGEHVHSSSPSKDAHPVRLQDTTFHTPKGSLNGATGALSQLKKASSITLNFPNQKNGHKNHPITHGDTSDSVLSPVKATLQQVLHLRKHSAPPDTPLYTYFDSKRQYRLSSKDLTNALRTSCSALGSSLGIQARDISARALRNGGAVALIRAGVDPLEARLMGRWNSWAMIEYLQAQSLSTHGFAQQMLNSGEFVIPRHQFLPSDVLAMSLRHPQA